MNRFFRFVTISVLILSLLNCTNKKEEANKIVADFNIENEITHLPDSTIGDKTFGLINLSVANLRLKPEHSAELSTQALMGTPVKMLKKENGWYLVQTPDTYISWIDSGGIVPITNTQLEQWRNSSRIIFTGDNGTIYENANFENPVSDVTMGNIIEETERSSGTIKVKLPDDRTGYLESSNWIDFNDFKNTAQPDTLIIRNMATQLMGRPYLWGGTSARAADCSGFVKTIYFMNGVILARDASLQVEQGVLVDTLVNPTSFQTGDLLFFGRKSSETSDESVTHVALSLGGNEFIHASGRVQINSFNPESLVFSRYRRQSFVSARRIIGAENSSGIVKVSEHLWY